MRMRRKWTFIAPLAILGIALFCALGGGVVRFLWNALLPDLFGWPLISFWQALGLLALCRILFGRSGWHRSGRSGMSRRMRERCANMTPEERERFRQGMRRRFGFGPSTEESKEPGSPVGGSKTE